MVLFEELYKSIIVFFKNILLILIYKNAKQIRSLAKKGLAELEEIERKRKVEQSYQTVSETVRIHVWEDFRWRRG